MACTITSQAKNGALDAHSAQAPTAYGALRKAGRCIMLDYQTSPSRTMRDTRSTATICWIALPVRSRLHPTWRQSKHSLKTRRSANVGSVKLRSFEALANTPERREIRNALRALCNKFDDNYWAEKDRLHEFPHEFARPWPSEVGLESRCPWNLGAPAWVSSKPRL
jgi:hypothetical protein